MFLEAVHDLGDLTRAGLVQVPGAIGDFSEAVNLDQADSVYVEAGGKPYVPHLGSYDSTTNQATFLYSPMLSQMAAMAQGRTSRPSTATPASSRC